MVQDTAVLTMTGYGNDVSNRAIFGRPLGQAYATGNPSVCNVGVLWPNGLSDRDDFWHTPCPGQQ